MNLDGLTAQTEMTVDLESELKNVYHRKEIPLTFGNLTNKRGFFIIDLIGNRQQTRAIIKKGDIRFVQRVVCLVL